jgi:hypothetical protein
MVDVAKSLGQIFWIGLVAGTLDITENIVFNAFRGITPWRIFQFIASGLIDGRLDRNLLYRRDSIKSQRAVAPADSLRPFIRRAGIRHHEFHRAAAFGGPAATKRRQYRSQAQRGVGVDVLYRIASRAFGQKSARNGMLKQMRQRQRLQGVKGSKFTNFARAA